MDAVTGVSSQPGTRATAGSIAICGYCAAVLVFDENLRLGLMSPEDAAKAIDSDPLLTLALKFVREEAAKGGVR